MNLIITIYKSVSVQINFNSLTGILNVFDSNAGLLVSLLATSLIAHITIQALLIHLTGSKRCKYYNSKPSCFKVESSTVYGKSRVIAGTPFNAHCSIRHFHSTSSRQAPFDWTSGGGQPLPPAGSSGNSAAAGKPTIPTVRAEPTHQPNMEQERWKLMERIAVENVKRQSMTRTNHLASAAPNAHSSSIEARKPILPIIVDTPHDELEVAKWISCATVASGTGYLALEQASSAHEQRQKINIIHDYIINKSIHTPTSKSVYSWQGAKVMPMGGRQAALAWVGGYVGGFFMTRWGVDYLITSRYQPKS